MEPLNESEVWVDDKGYAHDDEGNTWRVNMAPGTYRGSEVPGPSRYGSRKPAPARGRRMDLSPNYSDRQKVQLDAIGAALDKMPRNNFLQSVQRQVHYGRFLSEKQIKVVREILKKLRLNDKLKAFESKEGVMYVGDLIRNLEEASAGDKKNQDKVVREIVGKYAGKIDDVVDKLIFYQQFLEKIQEEFDAAGVPFSHPAWRATSNIKASMGDVVETVMGARKFGFK